MNVQKALRVLGLSIEEVTIDNVKAVYRKRMKKVHPDVGGSEKEAKLVNKAYEVLLKAAGEVGEIIKEKGRSEGTYVITIKDLMDIFSGKELNLRNPRGDKVTVNKDNINFIYLIVVLSVEVEVGEQRVCVDTMNVRDVKDTYSVFIDVEDVEVSSNTDIKIYIANEEVETKAFNRMVLLPIKLPYNIRVNMRITFHNFQN